ncbi:Cadherin domain protein [Pirellula sp. SH-Sr6A]|uniref:VCBS domain-containing protein n=1 Tax=Pirellula sp. SH-Sr6A TaxID=1632865 RepID=UPI00078D4245|nr:VCBS domain-containing protein [Pirellula sp. SH-Sr6A]AMV30541.1 Cadherin domain protein [Pirellula sp. SH-Sr6A]
MSIRRNHRNGNTQRAVRNQLKSQRLRDRVRESSRVFMERHQSRMTWWSRTFRVPMVASGWLFSKASTLWIAMMSLLGLRSPGQTIRLDRRRGDVQKAKRRAKVRGLIHEPLEARQLLASDLYVGNLATEGVNTVDFALTSDANSNSVIESGDTVTWLGADQASGGTGAAVDVTGLTFGSVTSSKGAFGSIQAAINSATAGDTIFIAPGTYNENIIIDRAITLKGSVDTNGVPTTILNSLGAQINVSGTLSTGNVTIENISFDGQNGAASLGVYVPNTTTAGTVTVKNGVFTGFNTSAIGIFGNTSTGLSASSIVIEGSSFANNGTSGTGGTGDIQIFEYNGNVTLKDLTLVGSATATTGARLGVQLRGVGAIDGNGVIASGNVSLNNIDISGSYRTQMLGIQRYSVPNITFTDVKLGGDTSAVTGAFGASLRFDAVGTGTIESPASIDLGNTAFRGLSATSAQRHELEIAPDNNFTFLRANATGTSWVLDSSTVAASALTESQAISVEDRILHYTDALHPTHGTFKGFVSVKNNQAVVTTDTVSSNLVNGSIARAQDVLTSGGTVLVEAGTFTENATLTKGLTVKGANAGVAGISTTRGAESTIVGITTINSADSVTINGIQFLATSTSGNTGPANPALNILTVGTGSTHTITNSVFFNETNGGTSDARAISISPIAMGSIAITNNLITGTSLGKYGTAAWGRGIWSDGSGVALTISGNTFNSTRSAINLDTPTTDPVVSNNTFALAGTGISYGPVGPFAVSNLTNNTFVDVDSDINARNVPGNFSIDLSAGGNTSSSGQVTVVLGGVGSDTIVGTSGADFLDGNNLNSNSDNDTFTGGAGDDTILGKGGNDTAIYTEALTESQITPDGSVLVSSTTLAGWKVTGTTTSGTDQLIDVETVVDSTGKTYRLVGRGGFDSIQSAIDAANAGDIILIAPGTFVEDVNVTKAGVTVKGAGSDATTVSGAIGGAVATIQVSASNVTIEDVRITREGNNTTDWNNSGLNSAGVAVIGTAISGMTVRRTLIVGNRTGIDINNTSGHTIVNNTITNNRTGMILRNQTNNLTVESNFITNNWTSGVLFLDASNGSNVPVQEALNSAFRFNNISGNWYAQVEDRQYGSSVAAPGTNLKNFSSNWFGSSTPSVSTVQGGEPGYADQIPVGFGGAAVAPPAGPGLEAIRGSASANIDFSPTLASGIDTNPGTVGFQPDLSHLLTHANSPQVGSVGKIQEAINLLSDGVLTGGARMVEVTEGIYDETFIVNKPSTIDGTGVASIKRTSGSQQIISTIASTNVTIRDLSIQVNQNDNGAGQPIAPVGIGATPATTSDFNGLVIENNTITSIGNSPANWSGSPSFSVRAAGIVLYDSPSGGIPAITITNNNVNVTSGTSFFQRAVWFAQLNATVTGNTFAGSANDLIFQFPSGAPSSITNNAFNGAHISGGGGLVVADPNAGAPVTIQNNAFNPSLSIAASVPRTSLQVNRNVASGSPISIISNTFNNSVTAVDVGGARDVSVNGNVFNPKGDLTAAGLTFTHVRVNSQSASSNGADSSPVNTVIDDNAFGASTGSTGTAIQISDTLPASNFVGVTIGGTGDNTYSLGISTGVQVTGGRAIVADSVSNTSTGVLVTGGVAVLSGATLANNETGVSTSSAGSLEVLPGSAVTGGDVGLSFSGTAASLVGNSLNNLSFSGQAVDYVVLSSNALDNLEINAIQATFEGFLGAAVTVAQNFAIEDKIVHAIDDENTGFVRVNSGHVYVTPNSFASTNASPSVQRAIDAASAGDTVHIQGGSSYTGGANASGKSIILSPGSSPARVTVDGDLVLNSGDVLLIEAFGTNAASEYDNFVVNGNVVVSGATLNFVVDPSYVPLHNDALAIVSTTGTVTGEFSNTTVSIVSRPNAKSIADTKWDVSYASASGIVLARDLQADESLPVSVSLPAFAGNGTVSSVPYVVSGLDGDAVATLTFTDSLFNTVEVSNVISNGAVDLAGLVDGVITLAVSVIDNVGNVATGAGDSTTKDTDSPDAPVVLSITRDTGLVSTNGKTSDNTILFSGTAEPNSSISVYSGVGLLGDTVADGAGLWSFDYTGTTLADGTYSITAIATDNASNPSPPSAAFTLVIETEAPEIYAVSGTGDVLEPLATAGLSIATGTISFQDLQSEDPSITLTPLSQVVSPSLPGGPIGPVGSLSVSTTDSAFDDQLGEVEWTYSVSNAAINFLAYGQTLTRTFRVRLSDPSDATKFDEFTVTVTVTGSNDAPVINSIASTSLNEQTDTNPVVATIPVTFSDADLVDIGHVVSVNSVVASGATTGLALSTADLLALITPNAVIKNSGASTGSVNLNFSAPSAAFDYLRQGDVLNLTYSIAINDGEAANNEGARSFLIQITGTNDAPVLGFVQDFETDTSGLVTAGGYGAVSGPATGLTGATGSYAVVSEADGTPDTGPFTRFGGYTSEFVNGQQAGVDVYLDITWALNEGFQYSVAANNQAGTHRRDFAFLVRSTGTGRIEIGAANGATQTALTSTPSNAATVLASGWYTLTHVFNDVSGVLSVDLILTNKSTGASQTIATLSDPSDLIATAVGGIRYGWFTDISLPSGLAIDNLKLGVYEGAITEVADGTAGEATATYSDSGVIKFSDVDLTDTHTVAATAGALGYIGVFTPTISNVATGSGQGAVSWTFTASNSELDYLAAGETLTQVYTITVTDVPTGATSSQTVTITITGTNDAPTVTATTDVSETLSEGDAALSTSGSFNIEDVDVTDVVTVSNITVAATGTTTGAPTNLLGLFTAELNATIIDGTATTGTVDWTFNAAAGAFDYLAAGQQIVLTYTVTVSDDNVPAGSATQDIVITITGTNDAPVLGFVQDFETDTSGLVTAGGYGAVSGPATGLTGATGSYAVVSEADGTPDTGPFTRFGGYTSEFVNGQQAGVDVYLDITWALNEGFQYSVAANNQAGTHRRDFAFLVRSTGTGRIEIGAANGATQTALTSTPSNAATVLASGWYTLTHVFNDVSGVLSVDLILTNKSTGASQTIATLSDPSDLIATAVGGIRYGWFTDISLPSGLAIDNLKLGVYEGAITEVADGTAGEATATYSDSGVIKFSDVDLTDTHTVAATAGALGYIGVFTPTISNVATGSGQGAVSWTFTASNSELDYLAAGETLTQVYTITVTDVPTGATSSQTVTITITGTNDAPTVTATTDVSETLSEGDAALSTSGSFNIEDVDVTDVVTVSNITVAATGTTTGAPTNLLGLFTAELNATIIDGTATTGTVDWTFNAAAGAFDYLAAGQQIVLTYTVTVSDDNVPAGSATQDIVITITGTNDAPVISIETGNGASAFLTEGNAGLTATDTLTVTELDRNNMITTSVVSVVESGTGPTTGRPANAALLGMFSVSPTTLLSDTSSTSEQFTWAFNSVSEAFNYLAAGETLILTYTVRASDGTASDDQEVVITITGTNDAPVLGFVQDFETDTSGLVTAGGYGAVSGPATGLTGATGSYAVVSEADGTPDTGPFTRFGGYTSEFVNGQQAGVDVYLDITWALNEGFQYSVAANNQAGTHRRDFAFLVRSTGTGRIEIGAANGATQTALTSTPSNAATVLASGWYTLTHVFNDVSGVLSVDLILTNKSTGASQTIATLSDPSDLIATAVGGIRYGWFTDISLPSGLAIDNLKLGVYEGAITEVADGTAGEATATYSDSGVIKFSDVDLTDTHTVAATAGALGYIGVFTPTISNVATGSGQGAVSWTFTASNSELDYLAAGETLTQVYTITVTDVPTGATSSQTVTITITGTNDAPTVTATTDVSETLSEGDAALSTSGSFNIEDVDVTDVVTVSNITVAATGTTTGAPTNLLGLFTAELNATIIDGTATTGTVDWTFNAAAGAFDYLAAGQQIVLTYTVTVSDDNVPAGSATQDIVITITGTNDAPVLGFVQDFETDTSGLVTAGGYGAVSGPATGLTGATGSYAVVSEADGTPDTGPFTRFGGYTSEFVNGQQAGVDVYLDITWALNEGFQYSVAANNQAGTHRRDFAFLVRSTGTGRIEIGAANGATQTALTSTPSNAATVLASGWYTLTHVFNDVSGVLSVDLILTNKSTGASQTIATLSDPSDLIATAVGGIRYGWFTDISLPSGLAIDNLKLGVYEGAITEVADGTAGEATATYSDSGVIKFSDVDLTDTHTVAATAGALGYIGVFTPTISNVATGSGQGAVSWTFTASNSELDYLAAGETLTQVYTITVTDVPTGATSSQTVTITITGTNDAPTVTATTDVSETLSEGDAALSTSGSFNIEDVDVTDVVTVSNITVAATGTTTGAPTNLLGLFTAELNATIIDGTATTGTVDWTFNAAAGAFDYLAAGQQIVLTYTVTVSDDNVPAGSATQDIVITITGTNDAPVISIETGNGASAFLTEGNAGLTATDTLTVTELDRNNMITTSVVSVVESGTGPTTGRPANAALLGMFSVSPTTLLSDTSSTSEQFTWAFNSVSEAFNYLAAGETLILTYTVRASDGTASDDQEVVITITGTNDAAVINGDSTGTVVEASGGGDSAVDLGTPTATGDLSAADVDSSEDFIGASGSALYGTYSIDANGGWSYTLNNNLPAVNQLNVGQILNDSFTVTTADGTSQVVSITINGRNDAVAAGNDAYFTALNAPLVVNAVNGLLANDNDVDNVSRTVVKVNGAANVGTPVILTRGTVTVQADGSLLYVPNLNAFGFDTFSYTVSDDGLETTATVTMAILSSNQSPIAIGDFASTTRGNEVSVNVLTNDFDPDFDTMSVIAVNGVMLPGTIPATSGGGTLSISGGTITYMPASGFTGLDAFSYLVTDGRGGFSGAQVLINVTAPANTAPVLTVPTSPVAASEGTAVGFTASAVDTDSPAQTLTFNLAGAPLGASINPTTGAFSWIPGETDGGTSVTFDVLVSDGLVTVSKPVTIHVAESNVDPVVSGPTNLGTIVEDSAPISITAAQLLALASDSDLPPQTLSITGLTLETTSAGTLSGTGPSWTFTPAANFSGTVSFSFTVSDGVLATPGIASGTATLNIFATSDPDTIQPNASLHVSSTNGNGQLTEGTGNSASNFVVATDPVDAPGLEIGLRADLRLQGVAQRDPANPTKFFVPAGTAQGTPNGNDIVGDFDDNWARWNYWISINADTNPSGTETGKIGDFQYTFVLRNQTTNTILGSGTLEQGLIAAGQAALIPVINNLSLYQDSLNFEGLFGSAFDPNESATYTIEVIARNRVNGSEVLANKIEVVVNKAPVAVPDSLTGTEDTAVTFIASQLLGNDSDPDGNSLKILSVSDATDGSVVLNPDGTVTFTPNADFFGTATFKYVATDSKPIDGSSAPALVSIVIPNANDAPSTVSLDNVVASLPENSDTSSRVKIADIVVTDDGLGTNELSLEGADAAYFEIVGNALYLRAGTSLDFEVKPTYSGKVNVQDISFTKKRSADFTFSVTNLNEQPVVSDQSFSVAENSANGTIVGSIASSDVDAGDTRTTVVTGGTGAAIFAVNPVTGQITVVNSSALDFESAASYSLNVTVTDAGGLTDTAEITIDVTNVNEAPVVSSTTPVVPLGTTLEDNPFVITKAALLSNVVDVDGPVLNVLNLASPNGVVVNNGNDTWTFTPAADFNGTATFTYQVSDTIASAVANSATLTVDPVNDAPVAFDLDLTGPLENPFPANSSITLTLVSGAPANALEFPISLLATDVDSTLSPASFQFGATATVTVNGVPQTVPVADIGFSYTPATGAMVFNPTGSALLKTLGAGQIAFVNIKFGVTDNFNNDGTPFDVGNFSFKVLGVNDAPTITSNGGGDSASVSVSENSTAVTTVVATDSDVPAQNLVYSIAGGADAIKFTIHPTTGALSIVAAPNFEMPTDVGADNVYDVIVQVSDGALTDSQSIAVTVTNSNDAPVAVNDFFAASNNATIALNVLANDFDVDSPAQIITIINVNGTAVNDGSIVLLGSFGTLNVASVTSPPATNFNFNPAGPSGTTMFTYTIQDSSGATSTATVTLSIAGVNNAPTAGADTFNGFEDLAVTGNVLDNDSDIDGNTPLTAVLLSQPVAVVGGNPTTTSAGTVSMLADGSFVYTPVPDFFGVARFMYRVIDSRGGINTATVTLNMASTNDAPVGVNKTIALNRAPGVTPGAYTLILSDFELTDPKDSPVNVLDAVRIASLPTTGQLRLNNVAVTAGQVVSEADIAAGKLEFFPAMNVFGAAASTFSFRVIDNGGTLNGGVNEDLTAKTITFSVASTDTTAPQISGVYVNSAAWNPVFRDFADGGFDSNARGYAIPLGSSNQLLTLPWVNINQILVQFTEDVGASLSVSDFSLLSSVAGIRADGATSSIPQVVSVAFNPTTFIATLTLNQSLDASVINLQVLAAGVTDSSGNRLDGEWSNTLSAISGNGFAGGDFNFQFNVLPGKAAQVIPNETYSNAAVSFGTDGLLVIGAQAGFIEDGYVESPYSIFADINGSGDSVDSIDVESVVRRIASRLLRP